MTPVQPGEFEEGVLRILQEHRMGFDEAGGIVMRMIRSKARSMPDAELQERVQEVWLGLCRYVRTGRLIESLEALLITMAQRQAYRWLDRQRLRPEDDLESSPELVDRDPENHRTARLDLLVVREFLLAASPPCVRVLDLLHEGYELKEISQQLGKAFTAVRQSWSRCMKLVRVAFQADSGARNDLAAST